MNDSMNDHQRANKNAVKATIESEAAYERFKQDPTEENRRAYEEAERRWQKAQARRKFEQLERLIKPSFKKVKLLKEVDQ